MSQTILVIDDDEHIRSVVEHFLRGDGYEVIIAPDGQAGIAAFEAHHPALIVLDVAMPMMSGFEVAQQIRAIEQREDFSRTPIILLTAYARSFFMSAGSDAGIDSYLTKPLAPEKLLAHIHKFLDEDQPPAE